MASPDRAPARTLRRRARWALALACLGAPAVAFANGRPPTTTSVTTRPDNDQDVYLATTFGLLISHDDACSFRWVCEQAIGYGGTFDPKYAVAPDGTLYATTFDGLRISRDSGCTWTTATEDAPKGDPGRIAGKWVDAIDIGADGAVWVATAESGGANDVYRSTDGGQTFVSRNNGSPVIWWKSVKTAPSRAQRVYVSGYQVAGTADDGGPLPPQTHLLRTDDGGDTWDPRPLDGVVFGSTPLVLVEAVDPTDPDILYIRSLTSNPPGGDRLYRSTDGGVVWTEVLATSDLIRRVLIRADGVVMVATIAGGVYSSADHGMSFEPVANQPQMACLAQRSDGDLFACGANWEPDYLSLGRSTDGTAWDKVFRFVEIAGPVQCPAGTVQFDTCEAQIWPGLREQFGAMVPACAAVDAAPGDHDAGGQPPKGCCDVQGGSAVTSLAGAGLVALAFAWRRRGQPAR